MVAWFTVAELLFGVAQAAPYEALVQTNIRRRPDHQAPLRGRVKPGFAFEVNEVVEGPGCADGWGQLVLDGYLCMTFAVPSELQAQSLPVLILYDPPEPSEYQHYRKTGEYDDSSVEELVPFVYGRAMGRFKGKTWPSIDAFLAGQSPTGRLRREQKFHFDRLVETAQGPVLIRDEDGVVVPTRDTYLYPISRFSGRDLEAEPLAEGHLPAFVYAYEGAEVHLEADASSLVVATLSHHSALEVAAPEGGWTTTSGGFLETSRIRWWVHAPAPPEVAADEVWIDVDRQQQMLALRRGSDTLYVTLVSTGVPGPRYQTRTGLYRVYDKMAWGNMASLPGAEDEYHVDNVPWIMHFYPRYALHGVFWHWGFGHHASHGCINLSPRDAAWLFSRITPRLPQGWHTVFASPEDPGVVLRVRDGGDIKVVDRRR